MSSTSSATALREAIVQGQTPSPLSFHWESPFELKANWEAYTSARDTCEWRPSESGTVIADHEASQDEYDAHLWKYVPFPFCDPFCQIWNESPPTTFCSAVASDDQTWRIQRIGPIASNGGDNFIIIRGDDALELSRELGAHPAGGWVTAIFLAAVDSSGTVLGYPPIHIHHSHLGPHSMIGILDFVAPLHFPHGETSCQPADGGDLCYMFTFPPGTGYHVSEPFLLNAYLNDVRAAGSPRLDVTLELTVRYTRRPVRRNLGVWYVATDSDTNAFAMLLQAKQSFYTFTVPYNDQSVIWSTFKSVASGTLLNIWHHTHVTEGFDEMWLIDATPPQLGLEDGGRLTLPGCNSPFVPSRHGMASDDVRRVILGHMQAKSIGFRCLWREPNVQYVADVPSARAGRYGRQTRVECFEGSERVLAGQYMTFVGFFDTAALCEHCGGPESGGAQASGGGKGIPFYQGSGVQQHLHFQGYLMTDDNTSNLTMLFANRYDSYEWTTHPVREETLYCAFGSKFAAPHVCPWDLPGCAQPRYPQPTPSTAALAFGVWGRLVQLSYFHWATVLACGLLANLLLLGAAYWLCCVRGRAQSAKASTSRKPANRSILGLGERFGDPNSVERLKRERGVQLL